MTNNVKESVNEKADQCDLQLNEQQKCWYCSWLKKN